MSKSPITCHGKPAAGVQVELYQSGHQEDSWYSLAEGVTDADGRCSTLLDPSLELAKDTYKMKFWTGKYFQEQAKLTFYPYVEVVFTYERPSHHHIPLLLSQFSYTTYRGS